MAVGTVCDRVVQGRVCISCCTLGMWVHVSVGSSAVQVVVVIVALCVWLCIAFVAHNFTRDLAEAALQSVPCSPSLIMSQFVLFKYVFISRVRALSSSRVDSGTSSTKLWMNLRTG